LDIGDAPILLHCSGRSLKNEGLDLPDSEAAWVEATTACGELLRNLNGRLRPGDHWSMHVKDEAGTDLYILEFKTSREQ
jgi:hypothetical protein